ncbi:MAG TPA: aspartate carbamoyltransferase catalytic subunit [Candidatus Sulfotelmatobacter sp.]|nr:aspartate carbamoyltransferase catalytic subunit [Candidatus Sulfotelmatobacter sp.]
MPYRFGHMLAIEPLSAEEISFLLDQSKPFQEIQQHPLKKLATLRGKTVALAFFEPSTRTRVSFATAAARLGADQMNLQAESSSLKKGESLLDTVRTLDAMKPDCIVMRHSSSGAPNFVARNLPLPVINAGDGTHEHPTQALLDALTIRDRRGTLGGLNVTILGDILHSRVARSNVHLLSKFGSHITLCGPAMWLPRELECLVPAGASIRRVARIEDALEGADVVLTLRVQQERLHEPALAIDEYILQFQLTPERLRIAKPDALVLHPGPMIRGLEIDPAVADGPQSCVLEQVTNGLAVRMALLFLMIGADTSSERDSSHAAD